MELTLSSPMPPYSSGMSTAAKPSSAALRSSVSIAPGSLASMAATRGRISSRAKRAAVAAICRCSSLRSSGVKTSAGVRVSSKKLPPAAAAMGDGTMVDIGFGGLLERSIPPPGISRRVSYRFPQARGKDGDTASECFRAGSIWTLRPTLRQLREPRQQACSLGPL